MPPVSIEPATARMAELVRGVPEDRLGVRTPSDITVGELLDHIQMLSRAFAAAAAKAHEGSTSGPPPRPDAARLGDAWRDRIPLLLEELGRAWDDPTAWQGMTKAGGLDMPGEAAGVVALDEVVLHGWDLAVSTGQPYDVEPEMLEPLMPFLTHLAEPSMEPAREGLFGPVVPVPDDAPRLSRALGLAGRHPGWTPD